jgi:hypothetical protein
MGTLVLVTTRQLLTGTAVELIMIRALIEHDDLRKLSRLDENVQLATVSE